MSYPPAYLEIQVTFARRLAELTGQPFQESVLHNTALYRMLGLDWSLDQHHPVWRSFIAALQGDGTGFEAAYGLYAERHAQGLIPDYVTGRPHWGCFFYEYHPEPRVVRLHFANLDTTGAGPLSSQRQETRRAELQAMFAHIHREHPAAKLVKGGSWLYNRTEYQRLFPPQYCASAQVDQPLLIARVLWGQFLRHGNRLNEDVAAQFLARVVELRDPAQYASCFPYQNLRTEASIQLFYAHYGISDGISDGSGEPQ
jgi:hypothetical protein